MHIYLEVRPSEIVRLGIKKMCMDCSLQFPAHSFQIIYLVLNAQFFPSTKPPELH